MPKRLNIEPNNIQFKIISTDDFTHINTFYCGNYSIESFLKEEAYYSHISREASTTLVYVNTELACFYTLRRTPLKLGIDIKADIPEHHHYSLDLARLGVSTKYQGQGIGSYVVKNIIDMAYQIGDRFLTTDALHEKWEWYRDIGFYALINDEITQPENHDGIVYMIMDFYDPNLIDEYFNE